jgi:hypothetical protein
MSYAAKISGFGARYPPPRRQIYPTFGDRYTPPETDIPHLRDRYTPPRRQIYPTQKVTFVNQVTIRFYRD